MSDYFDAFEVGPTAERGPKAVPPGIFRGIYAMPMFVTVPTSDLSRSTDFWTRGLGFIDLFSIPGQVVHLRRWAFQDVLLVAAPEGAADAETPAMSVSFSCVLNEIEAIAAACAEIDQASVSEPRDTPWRTRDIEVITPERTRVVYTAPREFDPDSEEARNLAAVGISAPGEEGRGDNGLRD